MNKKTADRLFFWIAYILSFIAGMLYGYLIIK